ncbi:hypothetical protein [Aeoliella mucimassa]|uniref:Uncharacterized protein n=1 Tax=Aeoliella mucimassa TaxID=2527972 RepID=A0A518AS72_9BACT|nr:hypothetical protein [Aeoliella mucimassa]QDU57558.1 hypothetical protein Pan181_37760 [Aeoliella mucimassa]
MKTLLPPIAVIVGILLLVLSFLWGTLASGSSAWTEEKSQQLSDLGAETNMLQFQIEAAKQNPTSDPRQSPEYLQAQYEKKLEEYNQLNEEFESARDSPGTISAIMRYSSIALIGVAVVVLLVARNEE